MFKKSIPLALGVLAGCVALPPGLFGAASKNESSSKSSEFPSSTAPSAQTPGPAISPLQTAKPDSPASGPPASDSLQTPSTGVAGTPVPGVLSPPASLPNATQNPATPSSAETTAPVSTPTPTPYAVSVIIETPASNVIFLPLWSGGSTENSQQVGPVRLQLKAVVTLSNQATSSAVTWSSPPYDYFRATVSESGLVQSTNSPGEVWITAMSIDRKASSSLMIEVKSGGLANIIVQ